MRRLASILMAAALVAGCASSAATPSPQPATVPPTAGPTTQPTPALTPSPAAVQARVTFDVTNCVYSGPTVVPSPAVLTIDYAPTPAQEGSMVFTFALRSDATQKDLADPSLPAIGEGVPWFALDFTFHGMEGSGTSSYTLQAWPADASGHVFDKYVVGCLPSGAGSPVGAQTIIQLVGSGTPSPAPSAGA